MFINIGCLRFGTDCEVISSFHETKVKTFRNLNRSTDESTADGTLYTQYFIWIKSDVLTKLILYKQ